MEQPNFSAPQQEPKKEGEETRFSRFKNAIGAGTLAVAAAVAGAPNTAEAQLSTEQRFALPLTQKEIASREEKKREFLNRIDVDTSAKVFLSKHGITVDVFPGVQRNTLSVCFKKGDYPMSTLCYVDNTKRASLYFDEKQNKFITIILNNDNTTEQITFRPVFNQQGEVIEFDEK